MVAEPELVPEHHDFHVTDFHSSPDSSQEIKYAYTNQK